MATVATLLVVVVMAATIDGLQAGGQCDGSVPEWQIPDDYAGGGCVGFVPFWEGWYPWNWGAAEICLGMCWPGARFIDCHSYGAVTGSGTRVSPPPDWTAFSETCWISP